MKDTISLSAIVMTMKCAFIIVFVAFCPVLLDAQGPAFTQTVTTGPTVVSVADLEHRASVNPMIYGQMLEDCNDNVIYGGVVNKAGEENKAVTEQLRKLQIPIVRWPAGTAIYDYEWRRGVGPDRTPQSEKIWGGTEYYTFGTDEFIRWCQGIGTEPYINIPMGNNNAFTHSLGEALDWVEYVNGAADSPMGAYRARCGHKEPYGVKYWCLGNENYLANRFHKSESDSSYAEQLLRYASANKASFPDISLLGVGHNGGWNTTVLNQCGTFLDYLTLHFYLTAKVREQVLLNPAATLFGSERVEANLRCLIAELEAYNALAGRSANPVRFSIDEWNCRHSIFNGSRYAFSRKDDRRLYDVAAMASMLNVFIRTSPHVAMANYIFPVNGHGLLKTVGEQDAYASACYYAFDLYRRFMTGSAVGVNVKGPGIRGQRMSSLLVEGDNEAAVTKTEQDLCFIGSAAVVDDEDRLVISLVNRSYDERQKVRLSVPSGYKVMEAWSIDHADVCTKNTDEDRNNIMAKQFVMKSKSLVLNPCAVAIVVLQSL